MNKLYTPSPIWFRDEYQNSVLIQSDASGDAGFGFCAAGFHVTGRWSPSIDKVIQNDMFVKEMLPPTIAILLLHRWLPNYIYCIACDNSGVVFRINCGSCRNPLGRKLIQASSDALAETNSHVLVDWNNRGQLRAQHADILSKILTTHEWQNLQQTHRATWTFNIYIHHINSNKTISANIRIPRIAEALPTRLRHTRRHTNTS